MNTPSPSRKDGQPIGRPMGSAVTVDKTKQSRKRAHEKVGLVFDKAATGEKRYAWRKARRRAAMGSAYDIERLRSKVIQRTGWGWKPETICARMGLPAAVLIALLRNNGNDAEVVRLLSDMDGRGIASAKTVKHAKRSVRKDPDLGWARVEVYKQTHDVAFDPSPRLVKRTGV